MTLYSRLRNLKSILSRQALTQHLRDPLYANSYFLFANTVLGSLLGFVYWLVVARLFPADEVGVGTAVVSTATLLAGIGNLGLGLGIIRFLSQVSNEHGHTLIDGALVLSFAAASVVGAVFLIGLSLWPATLEFLLFEPIWKVSFVLGVGFWAVAPIVDQILLSHRAGATVLLRNTIMHVIKLVLVFALVFAGGEIGVYASFATGVAVSCVVGVLLLQGGMRAGYRFRVRLVELLKETTLLRFSVGSHIGNYLQAAPSFIIPLIILNRFGEVQTAQFYMAFMVASLLYAVTLAFATSAFVEGSLLQDGPSPLLRILKVTAVILVLGMLGLYFLAPVLLGLFGETYTEAIPLLQVLIFAAPANAIMALLVAHWRISRQLGRLNMFAAFWALGIVAFALFASNLLWLCWAWAIGTLPALAFGIATIRPRKGI